MAKQVNLWSFARFSRKMKAYFMPASVIPQGTYVAFNQSIIKIVPVFAGDAVHNLAFTLPVLLLILSAADEFDLVSSNLPVCRAGTFGCGTIRPGPSFALKH